MNRRPLMYRQHLLVADEPRLDVLMPHIKHVEHGGVRYALVPHAVDEAKVLRNLGYEVTPPILTNYDWCGSSPYEKQRITAAHITMNPVSFVLNGMGTGKTRAVLYAYDYLRRMGKVQKLLVSAPLSTLRQTWQRECTTIFPHLKTVVLYGTAAKRRMLLDDHADVYIINHDGVEVLERELMARQDLDMICVDELTVFKERTTNRWKSHKKLLGRPCVSCVTGLTGTPTPNGPLDAYGQVKLINAPACAMSYTAFREAFMTRITQFKWLPKSDALDRVHAMMQPSVRFTRDDCYDLPPVQYVDRSCSLSEEARKMYHTISTELAMSVAKGEVKAVNEADKLNKLVQIALGTVYTTDKDVVRLPVHDRLAVLEQAIEESQSKVIVFTPYKSSLEMLESHIKKRWTCAAISGDVSAHARDAIFNAFMHTPDPHVIVAHPATMSHGLTLTAASTIVWYGPPLSLEMYEQANARITRAGQSHSQLIVNISATKTEEKIYKRLHERAHMQGLLLELYEHQELSEYL